MQEEDKPQVLIRSARLEDAERIAKLRDLLGYPISLQSAQERIQQLKEDQQHVLYIAQLPDEPVVGWIHIHLWELLVVGRQAAIFGLIVDEDYRGLGIGRLLMQHAEQWAREQRCETVLIRSNIVRQQAHSFYERIGYIPLKTQLVLRKDL